MFEPEREAPSWQEDHDPKCDCYRCLIEYGKIGPDEDWYWCSDCGRDVDRSHDEEECESFSVSD